MKFMVQYPLETDDRGEPWAKPESMIAFAQALEANGIDAVSLTDHPAPSKKWMDGGGHATLDPFVGLSFFAAATERLHVKTGLAVLPYRNPLMTAKSMTSVDVVSGGRGIFVLGAGYLRSEFAALGVDFSERNFLFDEAIEAMLGFWGTDDFHFEGRHFTALGVTLDPGPVTKPHPPIWLGGNARIVRDRVARWGFGWSPMQGGELLARTARTVAIETDEDFRRVLADLEERLEANGRKLSDIDVTGTISAQRVGLSDPSAFVEAVAELESMGVTWTHAPIVRGNIDASLEAIEQFGETVVPKL